MPDGYDLCDVQLPVLSGLPLRLLATSLESGPAKRALVARLQKDAGLGTFRATPIDADPTPHPNANAASHEDAPYDPRAALSRLSKLPEPANGFHPPTVRDYAEAYRSGRTTPAQVAERILAAIQESDVGPTPLRAFIATDADDLRTQAREAAVRYAAGRPLSTFDGVPVSIKDELTQRGFPTTLGTAFYGPHAAPEDATVVARLRQAGALLIGKTNMHEIGIGVTGLNAHHGTVRNPYNMAYHSGGSSSGSAASVAAGICPVSLGADGGGSIRIPAAFCGLFGIKPTYGRLSQHGAMPLDWSVAHLGPMASSAVDLALTYALIAGPDKRDPMSKYQPLPTTEGVGKDGIKGLRIGIFRPWFDHAEPDIVHACQAMVDHMAGQGAKVVDVVVPQLELQRVAHLITIAGEMATALERYDLTHRRSYGLDVRINLALARTFTARDYIHAQRARTLAMHHFDTALGHADVLITPTTGVAAPAIAEKALPHGESNVPLLTRIMRFASPLNFTGLPAISIPAGYTTDGLPIGLQVIGRRWDENRLLQLAYSCEALVERRRPARFFDLLG